LAITISRVTQGPPLLARQAVSYRAFVRAAFLGT
jgi:hypothetical protein